MSLIATLEGFLGDLGNSAYAPPYRPKHAPIAVEPIRDRIMRAEKELHERRGVICAADAELERTLVDIERLDVQVAREKQPRKKLELVAKRRKVAVKAIDTARTKADAVLLARAAKVKIEAAKDVKKAEETKDRSAAVKANALYQVAAAVDKNIKTRRAGDSDKLEKAAEKIPAAVPMAPAERPVPQPKIEAKVFVAPARLLVPASKPTAMPTIRPMVAATKPKSLVVKKEIVKKPLKNQQDGFRGEPIPMDINLLGFSLDVDGAVDAAINVGTGSAKAAVSNEVNKIMQSANSADPFGTTSSPKAPSETKEAIQKTGLRIDSQTLKNALVKRQETLSYGFRRAAQAQGFLKAKKYVEAKQTTPSSGNAALWLALAAGAGLFLFR